MASLIPLALTVANAPAVRWNYVNAHNKIHGQCRPGWEAPCNVPFLCPSTNQSIAIVSSSCSVSFIPCTYTSTSSYPLKEHEERNWHSWWALIKSLVLLPILLCGTMCVSSPEREDSREMLSYIKMDTLRTVRARYVPSNHARTRCICVSFLSDALHGAYIRVTLQLAQFHSCGS